ncbi:hypothetical protein GCM10027413_26540 [Conyzicola nivalis]|uniref:Lipoprotein n=1 Tax=Conyzicola nivalis TaxID=1477021 RepID=A0A916S928_9MICO|nr:hypothetical protein [Conyzicola nivalis]GGA89306.1 hypothetical protein GCM10010979_00070 [Conyzicola nivalis]
MRVSVEMSHSRNTTERYYASLMFRMTRLLPALAAVALLAACSGPQSIAVETGVDVPDALRPSADDFDTGPAAAWERDDRDSFVVVVYGSSSCAPIPTAVTVTDPASLAIDFAENPREVCTADMAPTTFRFDTPDGVAADGEVELTMTFEYDGKTTDQKVTIAG